MLICGFNCRFLIGAREGGRRKEGRGGFFFSVCFGEYRKYVFFLRYGIRIGRLDAGQGGRGGFGIFTAWIRVG